MTAALRLILALVLTAGLGGTARAAAANAETRAFTAAADAFKAGFFSRAESEFAQFAKNYPASTRVPEAVLFQAEALVRMTNFAAAISLLDANRAKAGPLEDQYLFWIAETKLRQGNYRAAAEEFGALVGKHPGSARWLEALLGQATARAKLGEWAEAAQPLRATNGTFKAFAQTNAANPLVVRGFLLLSEAELMRKDLPAAEAALNSLGGLSLEQGLDWQRLFLLSRIQLSSGKGPEALTNSTRLVAAATASGQPGPIAESMAFHAGILESLGRLDEAVAAYQKNLSDNVPPESQRLALLKVTELALRQDRASKLGETADSFEAFIQRVPDSPVVDLALLTAGELRLRQHVGGPLGAQVGAAASTNALAEASPIRRAAAAFADLIARYPQSPLLGKAHLDLGWCHWLEGRLPESQAAWETAAKLLPPSVDQATAFYKLADVQFQLGSYTNALANYLAVLDRFPNLPEAQTNLFERALYQSVRAALAAGDLAGMTNSLNTLLATFPAGGYAERGLLLAAGEIARRGDPARARGMLTASLASTPEPGLKPQIRLAVARTFEQENDYAAAIERYDEWLRAYTNDPAVAAAEYYRACATARAGRETNALALFTNFIARFPTNDLAPLAQWWVADHYFRAGEYQRAELNYQMLFRGTNRPHADLAYEAQMMAGRAAYAREIWADASNYFTTTWNDTNCPTPLRVQALFAYGDVLMNMDGPETNKLANYDEAIRVFGRICDLYPDTREAALAWGQKAGCLLQWAQASGQYDAASNAFRQVLLAPQANGKARSIATVGLGAVAEKNAQTLSGPDRVAALQRALNLYLDVFYGKIAGENEAPDGYWTREAGLRAARVAETVQEWKQAIGVYQQLQQLFPALGPRLEKSILRAQEQLKSS